MKQIYLFSGLGADHRAFERLDFDRFRTTHVRWMQPQKGEALGDYAKRLAAEQVIQPGSVFVGLSFGGIVAGELAKTIEVDELVLLASLKSADELPPYYRWAGKLGIHKLLPTSLLLAPNPIADWLFGVKKSADRRLLSEILRDTDPAFLRWAMNIIVNWGGSTTHPRLHHIHGSSDRILPHRFVRPDATIVGGGHLMTLTNAQEISAILNQILA